MVLPGVRVLAFVALATAASAIGLSTFDRELAVALVFPSAGVAVLWLSTSTHRTLIYDAALLGAATLAGAVLVHLPLATATMAAVVAVSQGLVCYAVEQALAGKHVRLDTIRGVGVFMAGCAAGALVSAGLRAAGLGLLPSPALSDAALTALRNFSWSLGLGALGLLVLQGLTREPGAPPRFTWTPWSPMFALEVLVVLLGTAGVLMVMSEDPSRALGFLLMLAVLWASVRTTPVVAVSAAFVLGSVGVVATLLRRSPLSVSTDALQGAVIAQVFMLSLVLTAILVAIGTQERNRAIERALLAERHEAQRAKLLAAVLEHLDEGVSVITEGHRYAIRNPAASRLSGRGFLEPDTSDPDQPVMVDDEGRRLAVDQMPHSVALATGSPVLRRPVRVRTGRGEERQFEISSIPVDDVDAGHLVVNTMRDVTREKEERDQLVAFAGVVAHDLKNPLTVIRGWSESIRDELTVDAAPDTSALLSMIARVESSAERMRSFIDDLLEMTVARNRSLSLERLDFSALAEEVAEPRRGGGTRIAVQTDIQATGDAFLLRQLLDNLLGNAVKYVAPGVRPTVSVTAEPLGDAIEISVTDNGIGIPPDARKQIFASFVRVHSDSYSGTGLGLAICQRIVTRHGGRIWVDAEHTPGTRIRFTLPD